MIIPGGNKITAHGRNVPVLDSVARLMAFSILSRGRLAAFPRSMAAASRMLASGSEPPTDLFITSGFGMRPNRCTQAPQFYLLQRR